jgi:hypothetical protein
MLYTPSSSHANVGGTAEYLSTPDIKKEQKYMNVPPKRHFTLAVTSPTLDIHPEFTVAFLFACSALLPSP